ncbi:hypothetical protein GALMADRAFT_224707 [Galerina marginata CBS 339.88]|uniref:Rhodopsin domain-containing protein n=1 Tax=Galerina marginata (strain CBS 339.88) TaxID=685588 RepID=A0A067T7J4_GALM3|nr:hypothetical protein GALMADRAFT_224707 [Galerina marginata CBS 339.88]
MMLAPPFSTVKIILAITHPIALITTVLRLAHRYRTRRLWWDDFWALIALLADTMVWVIFMAIPMDGLEKKALSIQLLSEFGTLFSYTTALWAARTSVAVTIVRLLNPGVFRTAAKAATTVFTLFWLTLMVQKIFICGTRWSEVPTCTIPRATGYLELATDITGDLWLFLSPAYMLWHMKLPRRHHRLILTIFGCSLFTSASCVAHIYFILAHQPVWLGITGHIQLGVSIVVCNLLVLVTNIYRIFSNDEENGRPASSARGTSNEPVIMPTSTISTYTTERTRSSMTTIVTLTDLGSNFGNTPTSTVISARDSIFS